MFHFIEPGEQHLYKGRIFDFLEDIAYFPKLYELFENWEDGNFLLAEETIINGYPHHYKDPHYYKNQHGKKQQGPTAQSVKGGALLLKQPIDLLHPRIQAHITSFFPQMKEVWTGLIALQVHQDIMGRDFERICRLFYCALLADLMAFGVKEKSPFLCVTMTPFEHLMIEREDVWPYLAQVKPETSKDELFHGVLTLTGISQNMGMPKWIGRFLNTQTFH